VGHDAEIPDKKDEVDARRAPDPVYGTGATDNGAGSVAVMEAVRIWSSARPAHDSHRALTGEEQGLMARGLRRQHFASRPPKTKEEEDSPVPAEGEWPLTLARAREASASNPDNWSAKILSCNVDYNQSVNPMLESWLAPFHDMWAT
jgi:hypothetical protein